MECGVQILKEVKGGLFFSINGLVPNLQKQLILVEDANWVDTSSVN